MKVQKIVRAQGEWAKKGEDIKDGDVVKINDEGQVISGEYGDRMVFKVETRNGEKNLTFNQKSMNNLIDLFGDDTSLWVNKRVKLFLVKAMVSGKFQTIVYISDMNSTMLEDGTFVSSKEEIPVIEEDITDNLPF